MGAETASEIQKCKIFKKYMHVGVCVDRNIFICTVLDFLVSRG